MPPTAASTERFASAPPESAVVATASPVMPTQAAALVPQRTSFSSRGSQSRSWPSGWVRSRSYTGCMLPEHPGQEERRGRGAGTIAGETRAARSEHALRRVPPPHRAAAQALARDPDELRDEELVRRVRRQPDAG